MLPNILAILPGLIPSTLINITTPLIDLHKAHLINTRITLEMLVNERDIEWCDLIVFCRNVEPTGTRWLSVAFKKKKLYIYDIDDNFFELPLDVPLGKYFRAPERLAMLEEYIRHASLVRVYSEPMLERVKLLNPYSVKVNGTIDWRLLSSPPKKTEIDPIRIVYATSRVNDNLAELFKPALKRILEKYPDRVQVYFLGYNPAAFKNYPNVFFRSLTLNYEKYLHYFSSAGFDIGLAPLPDDIFHRSKSNLKVREYGACRIAGIYSDVDVYSKTVAHRETGILVKNDPDEWFKAISELIEDQELRTSIQEKSYQFAQENFSHITFNQVWYQQITETLQQPSKREESYQMIIELTTPDKEKYSLLDDAFYKNYDGRFKESFAEFVSFLQAIGIQDWFLKKIIRLVSGVKSEGIKLLFRTIKMYIETFLLLIKIRLQLFMSKNH